MEVLVTGGAGYIGSHVCVELLNEGYEVIIADNLINSKIEVLNRIKEITNKNLKFYKIDILDEKALGSVFDTNNIKAIIHLAGLKAVGESVKEPLKYYYNNVMGALSLCSVMKEYKVNKMVFSSSATVYGNPKSVPIKEDFPLNPTNPYGHTKLIIENMLKDVYRADNGWAVALLRYFNPVGAHTSGRIGEAPKGIPNNLMPYITQVASGRLEGLNVFGDDYDTPDGTGIRDYIHIMDLARGHLKALEKVSTTGGVSTYNLGTGTGYSVLDIIKSFEKATGENIPYIVTDKRPGDIAISYADPTKACKELGWKAKKTLMDMCKSAWNWQKKNPNGYGENR